MNTENIRSALFLVLGSTWNPVQAVLMRLPNIEEETDSISRSNSGGGGAD